MDKNIKAKGEAGGIPVFCAFDKIVPVSEVIPNPKNPNQHPDDQIELLSKIIEAQGWRAPVTVSTLSGMVVRGHGRLMAAIHAGLTHVPVDYQHYENEEAEMADLIADNRIAEFSEIDNKMLADLFSQIDSDAIDVTLTGYTDDEISKICDALGDAAMLDIDEIGSKSEVSTHKMRIDRTIIEMTDEEYNLITKELDNYVEMNGTTFGFVRWLFNED